MSFVYGNRTGGVVAPSDFADNEGGAVVASESVVETAGDEVVEPAAMTSEPSPLAVEVSAVVPVPRPKPVVVEEVTPTVAVTLPGIEETVSKPTVVEESSAGTSLLDLVANGTVAALRSTSPNVPSAAENAVFGFVRTLGAENRSDTEIGTMLQRAHDTRAITVPSRFLNDRGQIDMRTILNAMGQQ